MKDCIYASVNAKVVPHAIVELYSASKNFIVALLATNRIVTAASFTVVLDSWSSKAKAAKLLGLRLYFIDESFTLRSILLGVRHFNPRYSERAGGIRGPFMRWVSELLSDFGLSASDLFGSTTDAGPDVKWMAQNGISSKNPPLTDLLGRVVKTIYQTKHVEVMGLLFKELCQMGSDDFERCPQQLLEYKAHRFLGFTRVIRRILCLWDALVAWYGERLSKPQREGKEPPSPFPLSHGHDSLIQLLSMLEPITDLNRRAQGETANQVEVLLTMFNLRLTTLNVTSALRDYRSTPDNNMYFRPDQLMPVMANTPKLLFPLHRQKKMLKCSFISEIQLFLHPNFKQLDVLKDVIRLCTAQQGVPKPTAERNVVKVRGAVYDKLRALMKTVVVNEVDSMLNIFPAPPGGVF
ncbi:hypothetical protein PHMEG_00031068 [Phytophthora megakarya]|uniref:Uncharacterized protein n=1 Tax=Phytophthora megakarya TaxID=4795 RepID=A0A225UZJ1_9STRA|nr:hypothetical protein PHMEG_00031068 [Phytophthora megakarya]